MLFDLIGERIMHPLTGRKQTQKHIAKRAEALKGKKRNPGAGGGRLANTEDVLWSKVDERGPDECWPWKGWTNTGYGRTEINDRSYYAHRVIYWLTHPGEIDLASPRDRRSIGFVLHRCNNKICCNPRHLYVGTQRDNMQDRLETGGGYRNMPRGDQHHASVLSNENRALLLEMADQGVVARALSEIFAVNRNTVKSILYWHKRSTVPMRPSDERQ